VDAGVAVPNAIIVAQGNNANGYYIKFSNNSMICWYSMTISSLAIDTALGSGFYKTAGTWTFPVAFSSAPTVTATACTNRVLGASTGNPNTDNVALTLFSTVNTTATGVAGLVAFGVWA
jgi:hypothetical protein